MKRLATLLDLSENVRTFWDEELTLGFGKVSLRDGYFEGCLGSS
jgi:hypothetical protein